MYSINKDLYGKKFILFWSSQAVSQLGSEITSFALIIWAYQQTNSVMSVSLMAFCSYLPFVVVSIFAGDFIDRNDKKRIMLFTDFIAAICSTYILIIYCTGNLYIYHVYLYNAIVGLMNVFELPAETVAIGAMISPDKYSKASGYSSLSDNLLTVVTPVLATAMFSFWGLSCVILLYLATFILAFFVLLFFIKLPEVAPVERASMMEECRKGLTFLHENRGITYIILSMSLLNFFSNLTYENILAPMLLARTNNNKQILGIVTSVLGIGGIIGGLLIITKKNSFKNNVKVTSNNYL